jgi:predicted acyl esterase
MCAHPYDASLTPARKRTPLGGAPQQYRMIPQAGKPKFSTLTSWESPDPNFWVPSGYAVVNMNMPGYASSGGKPTFFSEHQGKCFYEAIEWVAAQDWCSGNVGLSGVSYLAISQYFVAACQTYGGHPPSLKCISPWEGLSDQYHDVMCSGGVPEIGFPSFWWHTEVKSTMNVSIEEFIEQEGCRPMELLEKHPFYDEYWKAKVPKLEDITLPMLICGSFADQGLHTMGSFRAFQKASSKDKWIYTHRTGKWDAYYSTEVQQLTREFMDCYLKGDIENQFQQRAPVRLEVRESRDKIYQVRSENEWPLARTAYKKLYLQGDSASLAFEKPDTPVSLPYSGQKGEIKLSHTFCSDTELTGYMKLRLWVEARAGADTEEAPNDMVICTAVNKLDILGKKVPFYGLIGSKDYPVTKGEIKVSRRELDPLISTPWNPVYSGTSEQLLKSGDIVPVDIALYPSSTFFAAGESIELTIASKEIVDATPFKKDVSCNKGIHVVHTGGQYDNYLLIPVV